MQGQGPDRDAPIVADVRSSASSPRRAPRRRGGTLDWALAGVALLGLVAIGLFAWRGALWRDPAPAAAPAAPPPAAEASAPAPVAAASGPAYPVPAASEPAALPRLDESDLEIARLLEQALGREAQALLRTTGFVRNAVATVDNLARPHASPTRWPVNPAPGRFQVLTVADPATSATTTTISPDNDVRYGALVALAESLDTDTVVALYVRLYPLVQQAYEELGYPGRHFNDRLVQVIDHLLAAPEPASPPAVEALVVRSETPLARPWQHYRFTDPALESLSAGQKIMVRVGLVNERRLKERLRALRAAVVSLGRAR